MYCTHRFLNTVVTAASVVAGVTVLAATAATPIQAQNSVEPRANLVASSCAIATGATPSLGSSLTLTARLKVWQLMQGQNGAAAMRFTVGPPVDARPSTISYHAINTKGTGATNGRGLAPNPSQTIPTSPSRCDVAPPGSFALPSDAGNSASFTVVQTKSTTRRSNSSVANPDTIKMACSMSGDPDNPALIAQIWWKDFDPDGLPDLYVFTSNGVTTLSFDSDAPVAGRSTVCGNTRGFTPRRPS